MFIYSVRRDTLGLVGIIAVLLVMVFGIVLSGEALAISASASGTEIDYSGVDSNEKRVAFIEKFGIKVDTTPTEETAFTMPENFDRVIVGYNELQKKQGLDLSKYRNKKVTRYTYKVTNYQSDGEVYANLFIYRGKVVACDISSADPDGFVLPLTQVERSNLK